MSTEKREEVIKNLTNTIEKEKAKSNGGNPDIIEKLTNLLESIENGTHKSKLKKTKK